MQVEIPKQDIDGKKMQMKSNINLQELFINFEEIKCFGRPQKRFYNIAHFPFWTKERLGNCWHKNIRTQQMLIKKLALKWKFIDSTFGGFGYPGNHDNIGRFLCCKHFGKKLSN